MNYLKFVLFLSISAAVIACDSSDDRDGDWMKATEFRGVARVGAVSFKIGDDVYVGLGYDGGRLYGEKEMRDFYKFDAASESWSVVDSFPGEGRFGAVAFVIGKKAYVGTGYRPQRDNHTQTSTGRDTVIKQDKKYYSDFYVFDGETGHWETEPLGASDPAMKFPGAGIRYGIAFSVSGKGYVGTGAIDANTVVSDFYSFDPQTGWHNDVNFPGDSREGGTAFVIGDSAVVCLGIADTYKTDVWLLNGKTGQWIRKNPLVNRSSHGYDDDYARIQRAFGGSFVSDLEGKPDGTRGYVVCGAGDYNRKCWSYSIKRDRWYDVTSLPSQMSSPKVAPVVFSVKGYGFITTGGSSVETAMYRDTWKFVPGIKEDDYNDY